MAELCPWLWQQFSDANGVPYSGAKVFFYEAGTATKKDVYTTAAGDVAQSNPVVLAADGKPTTGDIFFGSGAYKVVIAPSTDTDPPVSPYKTIDQISTSGGQTGVVNLIDDLRALSPGEFTTVTVLGYYTITDQIENRTYYWSSTSSASDDGGTVITPDSAPATGRWLLKYDDELNVKWMGAYDDGSNAATTTTAINVANTAIAAIGGGRVVFTEGSYAINSNVTFSSGVTTIMKSGSQITAGAAYNFTMTKAELSLDQHFPSDNSSSVTAVFSIGAVEEFYPEWWGGGPITTPADQTLALQRGIDAASSLDRRGTLKLNAGLHYGLGLVMTNKPCTIKGDSQRGTVLALYANTANLINIVNSTEQNGYNFVDINFGTNGFFSSTYNGVDITKGVLGSFTRCNFGNLNYGIHFNIDPLDWTVTDCIFGSNNQWGIYFTGAGTDVNIRVQGCWFDENLAGAIYTNSSNVIIQSNCFQDNTDTHIQIDASAVDVNIVGNTISAGSVPSTNTAIVCAGTDCLISSNNFIGFTGNGDVTFTAAAVNNRFVFNNLDTSNSLVISDSGTSTAFIFADSGNIMLGRSFGAPAYRADVEGDIRIQGTGKLYFGSGTPDVELSRSAANTLATPDILSITNATTASSTTTGALLVTGGISTQDKIYVPTLYVTGTGWIGSNQAIRLIEDTGAGLINLFNTTDSIVGEIRNQIGQGIVINVSEAGSVFVIEINGTTDRFTFSETALSLDTADLILKTAGKGVQIKEGTNARMGQATLSGGTVTVSNTSVTTSTRIFLTRSSTSTGYGHLRTSITASTSFTITSTDGTDDGTVDWLLVEASA